MNEALHLLTAAELPGGGWGGWNIKRTTVVWLSLGNKGSLVKVRERMWLSEKKYIVSEHSSNTFSINIFAA